MEDLIKAVKSLLSDIDSMRSEGTYLFGSFSEYEQDIEDGDLRVEWPNLAISAENLKKALNEYTSAYVTVGGGLYVYGSMEALNRVQKWIMLDSSHPVEKKKKKTFAAVLCVICRQLRKRSKS